MRQVRAAREAEAADEWAWRGEAEARGVAAEPSLAFILSCFAGDLFQGLEMVLSPAAFAHARLHPRPMHARPVR